MRHRQDGAAGGLVHAAALHADEAVFNEVEPADAVGPRQLVELGEERRRRQRVAVDGDGVAVLEVDGDVGRLIRRGLGGDGAAVDVLRHLFRRVFQHLALGGGVQQVGVDGKRRVTTLVLGDRDLVLFREVEQGGARRQIPLAPGRDDLDVRLQRVIGELEAHLVVAFAGGAMGHRVGADLPCDLDLFFGDQRPGDGGAEQVEALVLRVGAEHRKHVVAHEFFAKVFDKNVLRLDAEHDRLVARRPELLALAEIGGEGDHLAAIGRLQPLQDDRRVEPTGIGEDDALDGFFVWSGHQKLMRWRWAAGARRRARTVPRLLGAGRGDDKVGRAAINAWRRTALASLACRGELRGPPAPLHHRQ